MSLIDLARADLAAIMASSDSAAMTVTLESPAGVVDTLSGFSCDIGQVYDPDTGQVVSGRKASISFLPADLVAKFGALVEGTQDRNVKPWVVKVLDAFGETNTFLVTQTDKDRTLGLIVCGLTLYKRHE